MAQKSTPLQAAMTGKQLSEKQAQGALSQAVSKISNLTKKANQSKEAMVATGSKVVHTAETQGSLFLSSMAEGYLGEDKLKVGGVDVRAPVGLAAQGYGLYQTLSGTEGGDHALALGNGIFGSWLASVGREAGRTLAEKRGVTPAAKPAVAQPQPSGPSLQGVPQVQVLPAPQVTLSGPVREVLLTPEPQAVQGDVGGPMRTRRERVDTRRGYVHTQRQGGDAQELEGDVGGPFRPRRERVDTRRDHLRNNRFPRASEPMSDEEAQGL